MALFHALTAWFARSALRRCGLTKSRLTARQSKCSQPRRKAAYESLNASYSLKTALLIIHRISSALLYSAFLASPLRPLAPTSESHIAAA
jgi:hypothetical protein